VCSLFEEGGRDSLELALGQGAPRAADDGPRASGGATEAGRFLSLDCLRRDGCTRPVEASLAWEAEGEDGAWTLVIRDVTERRRAEELLLASKEELERRVADRTAELYDTQKKYEDLYEHAPDMFVSVDAETAAILECNQTLVDRLGYTKEELVGAPIFKVYHEDCMPAVHRAFESFVQTGRVDNAELQLKCKDGAKVEVILNVSAVRDEHGKIHHSRSSWRDISSLKAEQRQRKKAEGQLRQAQKMETIGVLAGGIAHDFNNLLTAILGYTEILDGRDDLPAGAHQSLAEIQNAGTSAASLTRQLLAFSRKQVLNPAPAEVNALLTQVLKMADRLIGEHIELVTDLDPDAGSVSVDAGQFEQVLLNLIVNARDAMPEGGELRIRTAQVELDAAVTDRYQDVSPGTFVRIAVEDDGVGMDEATRARVFEPFFTTKAPGKGTGLGLSTAYGIIRQSQGMIEAYSEPGLGTTFRIYLPQIAARAARPARPVIDVPQGGSERVLVLEDDERVRRLADKILRNAGYQVEVAARGADALEIARRRGPFDLLLSDVVLAGMSGPEAAARLRQDQPQTRLLFMSGYAPEHRGTRAVRLEGRAILEKPFTADGLLRRVRQCLDEPLETAEELSDP